MAVVVEQCLQVRRPRSARACAQNQELVVVEEGDPVERRSLLFRAHAYAFSCAFCVLSRRSERKEAGNSAASVRMISSLCSLSLSVKNTWSTPSHLYRGCRAATRHQHDRGALLRARVSGVGSGR